MSENNEFGTKQIIDVRVDRSAIEAEEKAKRETAEKRVMELEQRVKEFEDAKARSEMEQQIRRELKPQNNGIVVNRTAGGVPLNQNDDPSRGRGFETGKEMIDWLREDAKTNESSKAALNTLFARAHNQISGETYELSGPLTDPRTRFVPKKRGASNSESEDSEMGVNS